MNDDIRFPIGRFHPRPPSEQEELQAWIDEIEDLPADLCAIVEELDRAQLDTPYRPGGWTVREVVHHLADSHVNSYVRFKLALTEDRPTIKTWEEARWAELPDTQSVPVSVSLDLLAALHTRWVGLLRGLTSDQWTRGFVHPEMGDVRLDAMAGLYAWHGRHHLSHITSLIEREGWEV